MSTVGYIHFISAMAAIVTGALIFFIAKGTRLHIQLGWAYVVSMVTLNGTGLMIYRLFGGFGPFHVMTLISLATLGMGYRAVRQRPRKPDWVLTHYHYMSWSYIGLIAAGASEAIVRVDVLRTAIQGGMNFGLAVFIASAVVCFIGGWLTKRLESKVTGPWTATANEE